MVERRKFSKRKRKKRNIKIMWKVEDQYTETFSMIRRRLMEFLLEDYMLMTHTHKKMKMHQSVRMERCK